jgi:hypothetical protein
MLLLLLLAVVVASLLHRQPAWPCVVVIMALQPFLYWVHRRRW